MTERKGIAAQGRVQRAGIAEVGDRRNDLRQQGARNAENAEQFVIPLTCADIKKPGARGIADFGQFALAETAGARPMVPTHHLPVLLWVRVRIDAIEQPGQLEGREHRVERQAETCSSTRDQHRWRRAGRADQRCVDPASSIAASAAGSRHPDQRGFALRTEPRGDRPTWRLTQAFGDGELGALARWSSRPVRPSRVADRFRRDGQRLATILPCADENALVVPAPGSMARRKSLTIRLPVWRACGR